MRAIHLELYLKPTEGDLILPVHYNHLVQAAIYNSIDTQLSQFLHEKGFVSGNRSFKMFAFSLLWGKTRFDNITKKIQFSGEVKLILSTPLDDLCQSLANTLLTRGGFTLGMTKLTIEKVYASKQSVEKEVVKVKTLSPVVLYSTMLRPDGRKFTVYFQPGDPDYNRLLHENLQKKYRALYGTEPPVGEVSTRPLGPQKMHIINYKGTIIKGYSGRLLLAGPQPLLQLAVDAGIGGKNSQGFGCVELVWQ